MSKNLKHGFKENEMSERQVLARQIKLKDQAQHFIREQKIDLKIRLALIILKERLEAKIDNRFDPKISKRLDAVNFLIEDLDTND